MVPLKKKNSRNTPLALTIMVAIKISINYQIKLKKNPFRPVFRCRRLPFPWMFFHPLLPPANTSGVSQKTNSHFCTLWPRQYQRCPSITSQVSAKSMSPFLCCDSWTDFLKGPFAHSVSIHVLRVLTSHPLCHLTESPPLHWGCSY